MAVHRPVLYVTDDQSIRYEIVWIKKGKGMIEADNHRFSLSNNTIYCMAAGKYRKYFDENESEGYYISFSPDFIHLSEDYSNFSSCSDLFTRPSLPLAICIGNEIQYELESIINTMTREYNNYFLKKTEILRGLLNIFIIYFLRNLDDHNRETLQTRETALVRKFTGLVKKNFQVKKLVSDYAADLCVTPNYLNRVVKKITHTTASYHIQQQIVLEAKRQAIYSGMSMKEIAYHLGFDNLAHFSKFFKNNCGINFTTFKKGMLSVV